jgi:hypothetical protein
VRTTALVALVLILPACAKRVDPALPPADPVVIAQSISAGVQTFELIEQAILDDYRARLVDELIQPRPDPVAFCQSRRRVAEWVARADSAVTIYASVRIDPSRRYDALQDLQGIIGDLLEWAAPRLSYEQLRIAQVAGVSLSASTIWLRNRPLPTTETPELQRAFADVSTSLGSVVRSINEACPADS